MTLKKAVKNAKGILQKSSASQAADLLLDREDLLNPLSIGSWIPPVDKCQTESHVVIRIELPGVKASDISVSFQGENLRIQGVKRESAMPSKPRCYFCLERSYGKFDRTLHIGCVVNPRRACAFLEKGMLTLELPKLKERRGESVKIKVSEK